MYLKSVSLRNFRSFSNAEVRLCKDLTIFVGENNGGKSNAIDAIRLLTAPLTSRREIYCESADIRFGSGAQGFELEARYSDLSPGQQGRLLSAATDCTLQEAAFGIAYDEGKKSKAFPVRPIWWAGRVGGVPEPGCLDMVRHVYLPPLRDAKRVLASGNPTRVHALMQHFLGDEDPQDIASQLSRKTSTDILKRVDHAVEAGLKSLTAGVRRQNASLGFGANERLIDIARDLRFKLADYGLEPEELQYSGHGYANLLYMATIAVELEKVKSADLTLFLVEEPEAHLHPQLQAAVLSFLEDQAANSRIRASDGAEGPAGELQVVVATHSPNLSAWVEGKKLVVFKTRPGQGSGGAGAISADSSQVDELATSARRETRCLALSELNLKAGDWRKVNRYLDVTRSSMLFGGRILLIEGIAEALLLPVIAREYVLKGELELLRRFRSAVFVPIDGVDFGPYVKLLLTSYEDVRIAERLVVVTDGDWNKGDAELRPGQKRKTDLEEIAKGTGAESVLTVVINRYSLESELALSGNEALLKSVYLTMHCRSEDKWNEAVSKSGQDKALSIQRLFADILKGDFAHLLAEKITEDKSFKVPSYLEEAIRELVR